MPSTLFDKAIVIAGIGRGIGKALAFHAAALGARMVVNDIDVDGAIMVAKSIGEPGHLAVAQATPGDSDGTAETFDRHFRMRQIPLGIQTADIDFTRSAGHRE